MALQKNTLTQYGVDANYWKLAQVNIDCVGLTAHVELSLYVSRDARIAGNQVISSVAFDWSGENFPFTKDAMAAGSVYVAAYDKIKSLPEFSGAQDV